MFPQFTKKAKNLSHPTTGQSHRLVSCVKFLSVASSLAKHFTELDIFYEMQHGFLEKKSCDTQLIM